MDDTPERNTGQSRDSGRPCLALLAAVAANGVIGANNRLPWHLSEDLRHFKRLTLGHRIVMGRRTWESIGRALPGRENVVVTRQHAFAAEGARVVASLAEALQGLTLPQPIFCIGGAQLYAAALPLASVLYMTEIAREYAGDTFFPAYDRREWKEVAREPRIDPGPPPLEYAFVVYERVAATAAARDSQPRR